MRTERILRVYLQTNWPRQNDTCLWVLLAPNMTVIERGRGAAGDWPPADQYEAVVTADQVSWLSISLPEKLGRDANQIIAYALEEKLLEPLEAIHFVVGKSTDPGATPVIAIGRIRLQEMLDTVRAAGRRLDRMFSEMQLAPSSAGQWAVCRFGDTGFLRAGAALALAVDWTAKTPPDALMLAIARSRARNDLPEGIVVAVPSASMPDLDAWSAALGVPVTGSGRFDPLVASTAEASNLLAGPFTPPGKKDFIGRCLRLSALALLLAGIGHTSLSVADWIWLAHQTTLLREEATTLYREAVPDSKAPLLNPSLQLQREAGAALRQRGRVGGGDMLTMLALLSNELPPDVQARRLLFDRSALEFVAVLPEASVRRIVEALGLRGYAVEAASLRQDTTGNEVKIRMYPR